ncbi:MAG: GNAT family N-acetyltransferase [Crocinitomix sp.]|nr:GNAT family N-acetyltransferase [Crocinitomix sp.]
MGGNPIEVRPATLEDLPTVHRLIVELAVYENAPDEVTNSLENLIEDGFGPTPAYSCLVATNQNEVIGFALYYISYSTWKGKCVYLEDFLVTEAWRRRGVGKILFEAVHQQAILMNAKRFEWQVLDWNTPAINFYKKYQVEMDRSWIDCKLVLPS